MEAVKKTKYRMAQLPGLIGDCKNEAVAYATCVISSDDVKKHDCQKEFKSFLDCTRINATKKKVKFI